MNLPGVYPIFNKIWKDCQTCYIISDTHFNDPDLIHVYTDRPTAEQQVKLINSKVGKMDALIHLGDVGNVNYIRQLKGAIKILICGNHDVGISNYQKHIWTKKFDKREYQKHEALDEMKRIYPDCSYTITDGFNFSSCLGYWEIYADNCLFDLVFTGPVLIGEKLILSHEPVEGLDWCMNVHGHTHDRNIVNDTYHFNVCADVIDYTPINFNKWMKDGHFAKIQSLHRQTIDEATDRRRRRDYKLGG